MFEYCFDGNQVLELTTDWSKLIPMICLEMQIDQTL